MKKSLRLIGTLGLCVCLLASCLPAFAESSEQVVTGTGTGHNGDIVVNVTLNDGVITGVEVVSQAETAGLCDAAMEQIPAAIVAANSADVDAVSGATDSSNGIIAAVKDALASAGIETAEAEEKVGSKADYEDILPLLMGSNKAVADDEYYAGLSFIADRFNYWADIAEENQPEIRTLKNGVKVQRTPSEYGVYAWQISGKTISYNTYFLNADERGCGACHEDLNETLRNMKFAHPAVWNSALGTTATVANCMFCHEYTHGYCISDYDFGTFIHGMHMGRYCGDAFEAMGGNCLSCHNMTADGQGVTLWDLVKYDKMVGIIKVPDVEGEFAYSQDLKQDQDDLFTFDWQHSYYDALRRGTGLNGSGVNEYPEALYNEWTITVEGNVNNPYTAYLKDLVEEAEAEGVTVTKLSKKHCTWNSVGGGGIGQVEITGIPVSWLLEKAGGYLPDSSGVNCKRADGGDPERSWSMDYLPYAYLVYKVNGEPLDATHGAPCSNWVEGADAQSSTMTPDRYVVRKESENFDYGSGAGTPNGWYDVDGSYMNNPNATILNVPDGLIVQTGEPHVFNGYADAYNEKITSVEISMDKGATWTKYDIEDMDPHLMLTWTWTFTPESDGSYVMMIRATSESGRVSNEKYYQKVMFTARSDANELE